MSIHECVYIYIYIYTHTMHRSPAAMCCFDWLVLAMFAVQLYGML